MKFLISILALLISTAFFAQVEHLEFRENKGQWNDNVLYKAKIPGGNLYLEENMLTYQFYSEADIVRIGDLHHGMIKHPQRKDSIIHLHSFKVEFLNAKLPQLVPSFSRPDYENYFIGKDTARWASQVKKYEEIEYQELYKNIGARFYLKEGYFKYDFNVMPGGNPEDIELNYTGINELYIEDGNLHIQTSVNEIVEQKPYAYQIINGKEREVKCKFVLKNGILSFELLKGYKKELPLIIDPTLIFASYSGSTSDNWGYTSTFDESGHLYGGGVSFGPGYPTTTGAYQITFNGGGRDVAISKFLPDGSSLVYSTYLGGNGADAPHSLIVNNNDELLILGTTNSIDFPVTINGFDTTQNGGVDIFISKLSSNGSILEGSTYLGGTLNDGLNLSNPLRKNFADNHRGEIVVDTNDAVFVATTTLSADFPATTGVIQGSNLGSQDACIVKLSSDLSTLTWSTYLGGSSQDAAYSLQFDNSENILVTGGTSSSDFPTTIGSHQPMAQGAADGWIAKINSTATSILAATYVGTAAYDQTFFVQLDTNENVYVVGQTEGVYPITPATVYNNPNSGQFLHKYSPDLSTTIFSTTFGTSSGAIDISLSAFLVNECNYILISGWGGIINASAVPSSTTTGLPVTPNAVQPLTDGSDYYLAMFSEDADSLLYGTFFGGTNSHDHVDGGTSRFDKKGIVYQAVCASCFNPQAGVNPTNDFPTTTGAWSNSDNGPNCNLAVFKIDLTRLTADAEVYTTPFYCVGDSVPLRNLSNGGVSYSWSFGDGNSSTLFEPIHVYDSGGVYNVRLIALDSISCVGVDTDYVEIFVGAPPLALIDPINGICRGDSLQLNTSGGLSYSWSPNYNILNDTTDTPTVWPDTTTTYTVIVFDSCGVDTSQITVTVFQNNVDIDPDTMICLGQSIQISASGGGSYIWTPAATLNDSTIANPIAYPTAEITYNVNVTDVNGCIWDTSVVVLLDTVLPVATASNDTIVCLGDSIEISASGGNTYSWVPVNSTSNPNSSSPMVSPSQNTSYIVTVTNGCGSDLDTVFVETTQATATAWADTLVCPGDRVQLFASGGNVVSWNSQNTIEKVGNDYFTIVNNPSIYTVTIRDSLGCVAQSSLNIDIRSLPSVDAGVDQWVLGDSVLLSATGVGSFSWVPANLVSCNTCQSTYAFPKETTTFTVVLTDTFGCVNADQVDIFLSSEVWVPNAFTPNGDRVNDIFLIKTFRIDELELSIFNRWGGMLFYTTDKKQGWDGIYQGTLVESEVYIWQIKYLDQEGRRGEESGRVTLIR